MTVPAEAAQVRVPAPARDSASALARATGLGSGPGPGAGVGSGPGAGAGPGDAPEAACWIVKVRPATSSTADRAAPGFGSTVNSTAALPEPVAREVPTQGTGLDTFHAQPAIAAIEIGTRPPAAATCADWRSRSKRHDAGSWLTVTRAPLITIAPARATGLSLAATATVTDPSPWPVAGLSFTHETSVVTLHEHSRSAVTVACTFVPVAGSVTGNPLKLVAHFTGLGPVVVLTELPPHPAATHATTHPKRNLTLWCTTAVLACDSPTAVANGTSRIRGAYARSYDSRCEARDRMTTSDFLRDARHSVRMFRQSPGFTIAAVAALALGIGANTAIFSIVNAVLLKPVPFPGSTASSCSRPPAPQGPFNAGSPAKFQHWREQTSIVEDVSAYTSNVVNLTDGGFPEQLRAGRVSADYFRLFGAPVDRGRTFTADEDRPGGNRVVGAEPRAVDAAVRERSAHRREDRSRSAATPTWSSASSVRRSTYRTSARRPTCGCRSS